MLHTPRVSLRQLASPPHSPCVVPVGKQRGHMAKLTTDFSGGNPPDLFLINFRRFGQFAAKAEMEPLAPALTARGKFRGGDFYEQVIEAFRHPGAASRCNCGSSRRRCTRSTLTPSSPCCTTRRATGLSGAELQSAQRLVAGVAAAADFAAAGAGPGAGDAAIRLHRI